jgi:site-specific DNA recombinase
MRMTQTKNKTQGYRIAIYVRVSTEEQAENPEGSIKNQEERLREYVKIKNLIEPFGTVTHIFSDPGVSAKDMNRPGFQKMLKAIERHELDVVLVTELSRFSRSTKDFAMLQEFLEAHECKFLSIRENFDTTGAAGQMVLNLMASIAEFERRQTAERISHSFLARAKRGLYNGGSVPLGYRIDEDRPGYLMILPEEAELVRLIFKTFIKEGTLAATAQWLNKYNIKCPRPVRGGGGQRAKVFRFDMIYRLLRNRAYIAVKIYKTKLGVEEAPAVWEPIIDEVTFKRANSMLVDNCSRRKNHGDTKYPYLLSGVLYCAECGERMAGASATSATGKRFGYYDHTAIRKDEVATKKRLLKHEPRRVPAARLEPIVWTEVKRFILDERFALSLLDRARALKGVIERDTAKRELQVKAHTLDKQINLLAERIAKLPETINPQPLYEQLEDLQKSKSMVDHDLKQTVEQLSAGDEPVNLENLQLFRRGLKELIEKGESEPQTKSAIIKKVVHKIEIKKDGIEIHYHVGQTHYTQELGQNPGSAFYISNQSHLAPVLAHITPKTKTPSAGHSAGGNFSASTSSRRLTNGGPGENRTPTPFRILDFESSASTSSTTGPIEFRNLAAKPSLSKLNLNS